MGPSDLLARVAASLSRLDVPYLVTGSMASTAYGEPRFTNDIDIVAALDADRVSEFCAEFYCWEPSVAAAARRRSQFNIVHIESGFKVDVILASDSEFDLLCRKPPRASMLNPFSPRGRRCPEGADEGGAIESPGLQSHGRTRDATPVAPSSGLRPPSPTRGEGMLAVTGFRWFSTKQV